MKCADVEVLLCEYVDGTLPAAERRQVEAHLAACVPCAESARDAAAAMAFVSNVAEVEVPPELVTRILYRTQTEPEPAAGKPVVRPGWFARLFQPVLQPRFAMGMAMTILSFSMIGQFAGVPGKTITADDMHPARVWAAFDTKVHRIYDRAVKYYENLRLVYEIQTRLNEWSAQEQEERRNQSGGQILEPSARPPAKEGENQ